MRVDRRFPLRALRRGAFWLCAGGAAGLATFVVETLLLRRSADALLAFDRSGNAGAALAAARPLLHNLLLRIAFAYVVFGGGIGLASAALAAIAARTRATFGLLWLADALAIRARLADPRRADGTIATRCEGECSGSLAAWLDANRAPEGGSPPPAAGLRARTVR